MRTILLATLALSACKDKDPTEPTAPVVDCVADETSTPIMNVASTEWPEGLQEAIDLYRSLDGRYTAEACGSEVRVTIRTNDIIDTAVQIVTNPLETGNDCGCTFDPAYPKDGDLPIIARTTLDITVLDYPEPGFSDENAGNLADVPVAIFGGGGGLTLRACAEALVPPVLLLDYRDAQLTFRAEGENLSGNVSLVGPDISDSSCTLSNWTRTGNN